MEMLVAAGALFADADGRIMLVRPSYQDSWEIPGGMLEAGETPSAACSREIAEELGLSIRVGRLLVADWAPHPVQGTKLLFVFDGGHLTAAQLDAIRFTDGEITEWRFVPPAHLDDYLIPRLARRLRAARPNETRYLEHGIDPLDP
jgi:ADP-ribose pyrophosphatase YjhB (NUDIX family)